MDNKRKHAVLLVAWIVVGLVYLTFPLYASSYVTYLLAIISVMTIVGQGLNVMIGLGGIFSFGQPGFMAFGAYVGAILAASFPGIPFPVTLIAAGTASALLGLVIGFPCLRLSGFYLAMATFGFSGALFVLINYLKPLTGGNEGMYVPGPRIGALSLSGTDAVFLIVAVLTILVQIAVSNISRSRTGRAWRAVRDGEIAAASMGIDISREKLKLFTFGSCLGGLGGVLYSYLIGYLQADYFSVMGLSFFLMLVVGGIGTVWGPPIGAAFVTLIPQTFGGVFSRSMSLVFGAVLLMFVLVAPGGVQTLVRAAAGAFTGRKKKVG